MKEEKEKEKTPLEEKHQILKRIELRDRIQVLDVDGTESA